MSVPLKTQPIENIIENMNVFYEFWVAEGGEFAYTSPTTYKK